MPTCLLKSPLKKFPVSPLTLAALACLSQPALAEWRPLAAQDGLNFEYETTQIKNEGKTGSLLIASSGTYQGKAVPRTLTAYFIGCPAPQAPFGATSPIASYTTEGKLIENMMNSEVTLASTPVAKAMVQVVCNAGQSHTPPAKASFDCKKAKSKTEKAICADPELSALDGQLANAYRDLLKKHPLPDYVKARQKDWLALNNECDSKSLVSCLKKNYSERLIDLQPPKGTVVFANSRKFSYPGDAVIEIIPMGERARMVVWGGHQFHAQNSRMTGKEVFVGCEFDGTVIDNAFTAVDKYNTRISFSIKGSQLTFNGDHIDNICSGFGRMPDEGVYEAIGMME